MQTERYASGSRVSFATSLLHAGGTHPARRDHWSELEMPGQRLSERFRECLHHPAILCRPWSAARFVGGAPLFSGAILLAPTIQWAFREAESPKNP